MVETGAYAWYTMCLRAEFQLVDGRDEFLLICSDGVWEFISSQEAVEIVEPFGRGGVSLC